MVRFASASSSSSSSSDPQPPAIPFSIEDILQDETPRGVHNSRRSERRRQSLSHEQHDANSEDELDSATNNNNNNNNNNLPADLSSSSRPSEPSIPPINQPPSFDLSSFRFYQQQQHARESFMVGVSGPNLQQHRQQQHLHEQQQHLHEQQRLQFNPGDPASSVILGSNASFDGHHSLTLPHRQSVLGCGRDRYVCGKNYSHLQME